MSEAFDSADQPGMRIFHASDFSKASRVAFAHALKIALLFKAELEIMHVQRHKLGSEKDVSWTKFPGIHATLARWNILPAGSGADELDKTGLRIKKILNSDCDPLEAMVRYCKEHTPDLLVLATHQREGLSRWLHKPVAEPLARRSRAMTLFVPQRGKGIISPANGMVSLRRILIPVDHQPDAQAALEETYFLVSGLGCANVELRLLHVGTERGMPTLYLPHQPHWKWEKRLVPGDPLECILKEETAWSPDLIVMATQGHQDFFDALRGSTTERVLRAVRCAVLAVPAKATRA